MAAPLIRRYTCPDCRQVITYHGEDQQEHGHAANCEGAQVCECPPGWRHRPDCPLVTGETAA